jgi:hypothetical protein
VSVEVECPECGHKASTKTSSKPGKFAWLMCCTLFCCGCCLCSYVPLIVKPIKDTTHTCGSCEAVLGAYKPLEFVMKGQSKEVEAN